MIVGQKIKLVDITDEHTPLIVQWRNNPDVQRNFIYRVNFTEESHRIWLHNKVETGEAVQFIIYTLDEDKPIGSVYLRDIDKYNRKAEFGIFIGERNQRGNGYGTESAELICKYGFEVLKLHKITLRVFAYNNAAIRSYEKVGFIREAYLKDEIRVDDKFEDMILMAKINLTESIT